MKGIMFSDELIPMVLDGTKTMTRRIMKPQPGDRKYGGYIMDSTDRKRRFGDAFFYRGESAVLSHDTVYCRPRYLVGETVYVKESWSNFGNEFHDPVYRADMKSDGAAEWNWKNKMFMPEWASRIKLEITGVRVERLQDISEEDAIAEGCKAHGPGLCTENPDHYINCHSARKAFAELIDRINGKGTWDANQWVWVYEFRRAK
jgi:hypothetical protein